MLTQDEIRLGGAVSSGILEEDVAGILVTSLLPTPLEKENKKATTTQHITGVCLDVTEVLAPLLLHDICFLQVSWFLDQLNWKQFNYGYLFCFQTDHIIRKSSHNSSVYSSTGRKICKDVQKRISVTESWVIHTVWNSCSAESPHELQVSTYP